jgi:hypothetical protein
MVKIQHTAKQQLSGKFILPIVYGLFCLIPVINSYFEGWGTLSNMPLISTEEMEPGLFMDSFEVKSSGSAQFRLFMPASKTSLEIKKMMNSFVGQQSRGCMYSTTILTFSLQNGNGCNREF